MLHFVYLEQTRVFQAGVSPLNLNSMGQTSFDRMARCLDSVWLPARPGLNGRLAVSRPSVAGGARSDNKPLSLLSLCELEEYHSVGTHSSQGREELSCDIDLLGCPSLVFAFWGKL